MNQRYEDDSKP